MYVIYKMFGLTVSFYFLLFLLAFWIPKSVYSEEYFSCNSSGLRVRRSKLCDGQVDCSDGSDETTPLCLNFKPCKDDEYRCAYGACIARTLKCDGHFDCADHSDETRFLCASNSTEILQQIQGDCAEFTEAQCRNGECIDNFYICDGASDCADSSDETVEMCAHIHCPTYSFRCGYGGCVERADVCNGVLDCADGSDELDHVCRRKQVHQPPRMELRWSSDDTCVMPYVVPQLRVIVERTGLILQRLDRIARYETVRFECLYGGVLVGAKRLSCDDNQWYKEWPQCIRSLRQLAFCNRLREWQCEQSGECIALVALCNGVKDCRDGSDETIMQCITHQCKQPTQYRCAYGACIANASVCNDHWDCADGSDETWHLCSSNVMVRAQGSCDELMLATCSSGDCIDWELLCDGTADCDDGSDETLQNCAHIQCPDFAFRCGYGACVPKSAACDGVLHCADGSDEMPVICADVAADAVAADDVAESSTIDDFAVFYVGDILEDEPDDADPPGSTMNTATQINTTHVANAHKSELLTTIINLKCFIPMDRLHLRAAAERLNVTLRAGSHVEPQTIVVYSCDTTWELTDGITEALCMQNGEWSSPPPRCEKKCDAAILQQGISTIALCLFKGKNVDCMYPAKIGTVAVLKCASGYNRQPYTAKNTISCDNDGNWSAPKFKCYPDCVAASVTNESRTALANQPYKAAIFHRSNVIRTSWFFGCNATILSPKLVISSALCFSINPTPFNMANDPMLHNVCIGICKDKYDYNYTADTNHQDYAVYNISEIVFPETVADKTEAPALVILVKYIILSMAVKPICLNFTAYNCGNRHKTSILPKQDNITAAESVSVAKIGEQECLVFVGEASLELLDNYKHWIQTKLNRYDYLL